MTQDLDKQSENQVLSNIRLRPIQLDTDRLLRLIAKAWCHAVISSGVSAKRSIHAKRRQRLTLSVFYLTIHTYTAQLQSSFHAGISTPGTHSVIVAEFRAMHTDS